MFAAVIGLAGFTRQSFAEPPGQLSLEWQPSPDSGVAGYVLYYGVNGGPINSRLDVGLQTDAVVQGLAGAVEYTFYVVAYDTDLNEGDPSDPLFYTTPAQPISLLTLVQSADGGMNVHLTFRVAPGAACRVEYTDTLNPPNWILLTTLTGDANGEVIINDPIEQPSRFYRAAMQ